MRHLEDKSNLELALTTLLLVAFLLTGCNGGDSSPSDSSTLPDVGTPAPGTPVSLVLHHGNDFDCFALSARVFCRGLSADHDIAINSTDFYVYFEDSNSPVLGLKVWNNTIAISTSVAQRPKSGSSGIATFAIGVATLQNTNDPRMRYDWTYFSNSTNWSSDVTFASIPMTGFDGDLTTFVAGNFVLDSSSVVTQSALDCSILADGPTLTCPTFEVSL